MAVLFPLPIVNPGGPPMAPPQFNFAPQVWEPEYDACRECGLYRIATTWNVQPEYDNDHAKPSDAPVILVLGQAPGQEEDRVGTPFANPNGGGPFLRKFLTNLDARWVLHTGGVTCFPGRDPHKGGDVKPTDKQIRLCSTTFLAPLIAKLQPKVIVCLGEVAMKAVMGKAAPKSIKAAGIEPIYLEGMGIPILVTYHPVNHIEVTGRQDLWDDYCRVFDMANELAHDRYTEIEIEYEVYSDPYEAIRAAQKLHPDQARIFDIETNQWLGRKKPKGWFPDNMTIWSPGTRILNAGFCSYNPILDKYQIIEVEPPAVHSVQVWEAFLKDRWVVAHNIKYDTQGVFSKLGICPLQDLAMGDCFEEEWGFDCTFGMYHLMNQALVGNGLDTLAIRRVGARPWTGGVDAHIEEAKKRLEQHRSVRVKARTAMKVKINAARKRWMKAKQEADLTKQVRLRMKAEVEIKQFQQLLTELEAACHPTICRPPESANMADVPLPTLTQYNAYDNYWDARLLKEDLIEGGGVNQFNALAYRLYRRLVFTTSYIERNGLPINEQRLKNLENALDQRSNELAYYILNSPHTYNALHKLPKFQEAFLKHRLTLPLLIKLASPKSALFLKALAEETGVLDRVPYTEASKTHPDGQPQFNEDVLDDLSGGYVHTEQEHRKPSWTKPEDKNDVQKLWTHIAWYRRIFDLKARTIRDLKLYSTRDEEGRLTLRTDYILGKIAQVGYGAADVSGGTRTGRLASRNMNLHNLIKDDAVRSIFEAPTISVEEEMRRQMREIRGLPPLAAGDYEFLEGDYDRIEPVVLTVIGQIAAWREIFAKGWDLYRVIANDIYHLGIDLTGDPEVVKKRLEDNVPKNLRENSKTRTLAIMYDESPYAFARRANISLHEAEQFYERFNKAYPEIEVYKESIRQIAKADEFIVTPFGRKCKYQLPVDRGDYKKYNQEMGDICRAAINLKIQATASDITSWKSFEFYRWIVKSGLERFVRIVNIVHDSLWLVVHKDLKEYVAKNLTRIMEDMSTLPFTFDVPLRTALKSGKDLGSMKKFETTEDAMRRRIRATIGTTN